MKKLFLSLIALIALAGLSSCGYDEEGSTLDLGIPTSTTTTSTKDASTILKGSNSESDAGVHGVNKENLALAVKCAEVTGIYMELYSETIETMADLDDFDLIGFSMQAVQAIWADEISEELDLILGCETLFPLWYRSSISASLEVFPTCAQVSSSSSSETDERCLSAMREVVDAFGHLNDRTFEITDWIEDL